MAVEKERVIKWIENEHEVYLQCGMRDDYRKVSVDRAIKEILGADGYINKCVKKDDGFFWIEIVFTCDLWC